MRIWFLIITTFFIPAFVLAEQTSVINNFSASASTGGNSASNGTVIEGKSTSHVEVYTEINGEVVTDINETAEDDELMIEEEVVRDNVHTQTHIEVQAVSGSSGQTQEQSTASLQNTSSKGGAGEATNNDSQITATVLASSEATASGVVETPTITHSIRSWIGNLFAYVFGFFK